MNIATEIGNTLRQARLDMGYTSRATAVETKKLKGRITQEGLRKIEHGERIPKLENLQRLAETFGLSQKKTQELVRGALEANIKRAAKRAGNATVTFQIEGRPVRVHALPPNRKVEAFVRETVEKLLGRMEKYQVRPEDLVDFRMHARAILLKQLRA